MMEKLLIDIPHEKSQLVKQLLNELGVKMTVYPVNFSQGKEALSQISVWTEEDIKAIEDASKIINNIGIREW